MHLIANNDKKTRGNQGLGSAGKHVCFTSEIQSTLRTAYIKMKSRCECK